MLISFYILFLEPRKLYIRRNSNKVDSIETGHIAIEDWCYMINESLY